MKTTYNDTKSFKIYVMEALLLLLKKKRFSDITIKEITEKAGVNRSTYYRNFDSKEDIIEYFYFYILTKCISKDNTTSFETHLENIFHQFLRYKEQLLCLHRNNLSYLLLGSLNSFFTNNGRLQKISTFEQAFEIYYHAGGVFNTLLLWFEQEMAQSPKLLMIKTKQMLPPDFKPILLDLGNRQI